MMAPMIPPPMDRNERRRRDRLYGKLSDMHGFFTGESKKSIANRALAFFKSVLFSDRPRLAHNVHVTLSMSGKIGALGFCEYDDEESRPRDFKIALNRNCTRADIVETVAHEMVHVWQYSTGKLRDMADGGSKYAGHKYNRDEIPYGELPWEVEAYQMEEPLIRQWIESEKKRAAVVKAKKR